MERNNSCLQKHLGSKDEKIEQLEASLPKCTTQLSARRKHKEIIKDRTEGNRGREEECVVESVSERKREHERERETESLQF